jgi:hypothetical protein
MNTKTAIPIKAIDFDLATKAAEDFSRARNVPSAVFPADTPPGNAGEGSATPAVPAMAAVPARPKRKPLKKFTVDLPAYVIDAIQSEAFHSKCTARHVVMRGLRAVGIRIDEDDMPEDGRRVRAGA